MRTLEINSFNHYRFARKGDGMVDVLEYGPECPGIGDPGYVGERVLVRVQSDETVQWSAGKKKVWTTSVDLFDAYLLKVDPDYQDDGTPWCGDDFSRALCEADPTKTLDDYYRLDED